MLNRDASLDLQRLFPIKLLTGTCSESVSRTGDGFKLLRRQSACSRWHLQGYRRKNQPCRASVSCNFCPLRVRKRKLFPSLPHDCAQNSTIYFLSLFTSSPLYWLLCTKRPVVTCSLTLAFQNAWLWSSANTSNWSGATDQLNYSRSVSLCLFLSREQQLQGIKLEQSLNFNHKL